jgi:hypothetical protein
MSFDNTRSEFEKRCYMCDSPTQSHAAPNAWLCHSCKSNESEPELVKGLDIPPLEAPSLDTPLQCWWCGKEHALGAIVQPGATMIGHGFRLFEQYPGMIIAPCPSCVRATHYVTTSAVVAWLSEEFQVPLHEFHRRRGWVKP